MVGNVGNARSMPELSAPRTRETLPEAVQSHSAAKLPPGETRCAPGQAGRQVSVLGTRRPPGPCETAHGALPPFGLEAGRLGMFSPPTQKGQGRGGWDEGSPTRCRGSRLGDPHGLRNGTQSAAVWVPAGEQGLWGRGAVGRQSLFSCSWRVRAARTVVSRARGGTVERQLRSGLQGGSWLVRRVARWGACGAGCQHGDVRLGRCFHAGKGGLFLWALPRPASVPGGCGVQDVAPEVRGPGWTGGWRGEGSGCLPV